MSTQKLPKTFCPLCGKKATPISVDFKDYPQEDGGGRTYIIDLECRTCGDLIACQIEIPTPEMKERAGK